MLLAHPGKGTCTQALPGKMENHRKAAMPAAPRHQSPWSTCSRPAESREWAAKRTEAGRVQAGHLDLPETPRPQVKGCECSSWLPGDSRQSPSCRRLRASWGLKVILVYKSPQGFEPVQRERSCDFFVDYYRKRNLPVSCVE